jgi:hypothetical protein
MKTLTCFLLASAILSCMFLSCNKNPDNPDAVKVDSATIMGFKDSTLLIKSIAEVDYDKNGNKTDETPAFYFYYDTLNKKVYTSYQPVSSLPISNYYFMLSYNDAGLISKMTSGIVDPTDPTVGGSEDFSYDAKGILKSQTTTSLDGSSETDYITKIDLPSGGYSLSEKSSMTDFVHDSTLSTQNFDANGRMVSKSDLGLPLLNSGYRDSIVYDAKGNVSKVIETQLSGGAVSNTYNKFEFNSRDVKGDEFFNFNRILFNGIADLPGNAYISLGSLFGGFDNWYLYQFTKYPAQSTKVYDYTSDAYLTFDPNPEYDSKGRLTKFKMYNGDGDSFYKELTLTYYK